VEVKQHEEAQAAKQDNVPEQVVQERIERTNLEPEPNAPAG
jgi:hypothetical protein